MKRQYQQLTYEQRCQISGYMKIGLSQRKIAKELDVHQSTISRELSRNRGKRGYRFKQAQRKCAERRTAACIPTKMTTAMIKRIESKLRIELSPEQVSGWLKLKPGKSISHESIYLHIWGDKQSGGDLYRYLRRQGKKYDKRRHGKSTRGQIKNRVSIEERPEIVEGRERIGDWEIDTVIGKNHQGALVTIIERCTQKFLCEHVPRKTAKAVTKATIALLKPYKDFVHTIQQITAKSSQGMKKLQKRLKPTCILRTLTVLGNEH